MMQTQQNPNSPTSIAAFLVKPDFTCKRTDFPTAHLPDNRPKSAAKKQRLVAGDVIRNFRLAPRDAEGRPN
jgi:hypothetical protein